MTTLTSRSTSASKERTVDHDLLVEGAHRAELDYLIATGARHKVTAIEIGGNHYFKPETLRERMYLRTATFLEFPHGRYSENLLSRDQSSFCT